MNRYGNKQTRPRHAFGAGRRRRRRFAHGSIMVTAVVASCAAHLWTRRRSSSLLVVAGLSRGVVRGRAAGRGGVTQHRANRSRHRQGGEEQQQDDADAMSPAHVLSIARGARQEPPQRRIGRFYREIRLSRSEWPITDTELKVIEALAIMGLSNRPTNGYNTAAATGTPSTL